MFARARPDRIPPRGDYIGGRFRLPGTRDEMLESINPGDTRDLVGHSATHACRGGVAEDHQMNIC